MQASTSAPHVFNGTSLLTNGLALLAADLVLGVLTNTSLPFISGERAAFIGLVVVMALKWVLSFGQYFLR